MSSQGVGLLEFVCDSDLSAHCIHTSTLSTLFLLSPSPAVEFELGHRVGLRWHCFSSEWGVDLSMLGRKGTSWEGSRPGDIQRDRRAPGLHILYFIRG